MEEVLGAAEVVADIDEAELQKLLAHRYFPEEQNVPTGSPKTRIGAVVFVPPNKFRPMGNNLPMFFVPYGWYRILSAAIGTTQYKMQR
eukprot:4379526-Heterocapsa_arctica.AAC.1